MFRVLFSTAVGLILSTTIANAEKLSLWQRSSGDPDGQAAMVQLYTMAGEPAPAYFGYRCYNDVDKFGLGNSAYFVKLDNVKMACMKDPVTNVTLSIDGKREPFVFKCDSRSLGGSIILEWGVESRADLNNMYDLEQKIDKSKSKEIIVAVTDTNHYLYRGSLKNAGIRKAIDKDCIAKR